VRLQAAVPVLVALAVLAAVPIAATASVPCCCDAAVPLRDTGWLLPRGTRWYVELHASRELGGSCCPAAVTLADSSGNSLHVAVDCHAGLGCTGLHLVVRYNGAYYAMDEKGNTISSNSELWLEDYGCSQLGLAKTVQVYFDYDCSGVLHVTIVGDGTYRFSFPFDGTALSISTIEGSAGYILKCSSNVRSGQPTVYSRCAPASDYSRLPENEFGEPWSWKNDVRLLLYAAAATLVMFGVAAVAQALGGVRR